MNLDHKSDVRFQTIIKNILATIPDSLAEQKVLIGTLIDLRTDFLLAHWISSQVAASGKVSKTWREKSLASFQKFAALRDSKEVQVFLQQDLYFFSKIDGKIFANMKGSVNVCVEDELRSLS